MPRHTPVPAHARRLAAGALAAMLLIPVTATIPAQAVTSVEGQNQTVTAPAADSQAPALSSVTRTSPDVVGSDESVRLQWTSDATDIDHVYVSFVNETGQIIYAYAAPGEDLVMRISPQTTTTGTYRLYNMSVDDLAGNRSSYYSDGTVRTFPSDTTPVPAVDLNIEALTFTVQGTSADTLAPALSSVTRTSPDVVDPGESVRLQWTSKAPDTHYVDAYFISETGQTIKAIAYPGEDLVMSLDAQQATTGTYRLNYIAIHDITNTTTYYYGNGTVFTSPTIAAPPSAVDLNLDALTFTIQKASQSVTPAAVVFNDEDGTTADTYTIPDTEGVDYLVNGKVETSGTYPGTGTVEIIARAQTGFVLAEGATTSWTYTFKATPYQVTPAAVVFTDEDGTAADTYTIPATEGVDYLVNGTITAPGTYPGAGTVTVTAQAKTGYVLAGDAVTNWSTTFSTTAMVTPAAPDFTDKPSTYTIPATPGVQYYVNGTATAPGTYKAKGTGAVEITARAQDGYVLAEDATLSWKATFKTSPTQVNPGAVVFADKPGTASDTYTIPDTGGVDYLVNGTVTVSGTYPGASTVQVKAKAQAGYVVNGLSTWKTTFQR